MKVVITGHTRGIGKAFFDHFTAKGWEVIGMSRSTGYNLETDIDKIVEDSAGSLLFINNTYRDRQQLELLLGLKDLVKKMVVCGSVSRMYPDMINTQYVKDKQELAEACRLLSISERKLDLLHLDLSFIEHTEVDINDPEVFTSDYFIEYDEIVRAVDFWLTNPKIRQMEFRWKLTPFVYEQLKKAHTDHTALNNLRDQVKSISGNVIGFQEIDQGISAKQFDLFPDNKPL